MFNKKTIKVASVLLCMTTLVWATDKKETEEEKEVKFNFKDKTKAQSALSSSKFCSAVDSELGQHLPPTSTKSYFCKKNGISDLTTLKTAVSKLTIYSCEEGKGSDEGYQRCLTTLNDIEGCNGENAPKLADKNKKTVNATIIYDPKDDCIVTAHPGIHKGNVCSTDCAGK